MISAFGVMLGVFLVLQIEFIGLYIVASKKEKPLADVSDKDLFTRYEHSLHKLIDLHKERNVRLEEERSLLREENKNLMEFIDSVNEEIAEEAEEEGDTTIQSKVIEVSSSRLFKKIEAARKLVKKSNIPDEVSEKLIVLLTPENDVEAA